MLNTTQKINIAQLPNIADVIQLLNESKSNVGSIIGDTEYATLVNAITLETEALFIARFAQFIEDIKVGNFHD